jgi:hypothetical protein
MGNPLGVHPFPAQCLVSLPYPVQGGKSGKYSVTLDDGREPVRLPSRIEPDERIIGAFARFHRYPLRTRLTRLLGIRR